LTDFDGLTLTHGHVVINKIHRDTICKHSQCGGDILDGTMDKLSGGIPPLLEESVKLCHTLTKFFKQLDSHSKMIPKSFSGKKGSSMKSPHKLVVPFDPLHLQL
jgi:hypothetical protein